MRCCFVLLLLLLLLLGWWWLRPAQLPACLLAQLLLLSCCPGRCRRACLCATMGSCRGALCCLQLGKDALDRQGSRLLHQSLQVGRQARGGGLICRPTHQGCRSTPLPWVPGALPLQPASTHLQVSTHEAGRALGHGTKVKVTSQPQAPRQHLPRSWE